MIDQPAPKPKGPRVLPIAVALVSERVLAGSMSHEIGQKLIGYMRSQEQKGLDKYGQPLHVHDGRGIGDAWEELADMTKYSTRETEKAREGGSDAQFQRLRQFADALAQVSAMICAMVIDIEQGES